MRNNYNHKFNRLKNYLNKMYGIDIRLEDNAKKEDCCYPTEKYIEIYKYNKPDVRLYALMHEAGHCVLRIVPQNHYRKFFPKTAKDATPTNYLRTKSACVETLSEEIVAWYMGFDIAERVGLKVPWKSYYKHMKENVWSYVEYVNKKQRFRKVKKDFVSK